MLSFDEILAQTTAVELLQSVLSSGRVPHALLFHGPEGVGKATTAATFGAALVCASNHGGACGSCACCSLIVAGNHPDFLHVGRLTRKEIEKKEKSRLTTQDPDATEGDLGSQILVDQIRSITSLVGLRPRQGQRRIFIVDPADRMNREAQNSLLKTLEEPPDHSALILVSSRPHLLLPTVRSRCFAVGFSAMRTDELTQLLERRGMTRSEAAARAALSGGSLGGAITMDLDSRQERRQEIFEMLETLADGPRAIETLSAMASSLAGKDEATLTDGLDLAQGLLRDAAYTGAVETPDRLIHTDLADALGRLGYRLGAERAAVLVASVERLRGDLRYNTNRIMIAEALLAAVAGGPVP